MKGGCRLEEGGRRGEEEKEGTKKRKTGDKYGGGIERG